MLLKIENMFSSADVLCTKNLSLARWDVKLVHQLACEGAPYWAGNQTFYKIAD